MPEDLPRTFEMSPEQAAAFSDPTRTRVMSLLSERPASISQLAAALGRPKGSVGHHVKVLEELGLIRVVRTRKVRAVTEKLYGRIARTYVFPNLEGSHPAARGFLEEALGEMAAGSPEHPGVVTLRHARIPEERAAEWAERLQEVSEEFAAAARGGDTTFGLLVALYPTDHPALPDDHEGDR